MTLEAKIEKDFVELIEGLGLIALKFKDPKKRGGPDRVVLSPYFPPFFVEFKKPGEKPRPEQVKYHRELSEKRFAVEVHDDAVEAFEAFKNHGRLYGAIWDLELRMSFEV